MQLNDLRSFVTTVEVGSVTRAASRLIKTQSAVSQAIGRLEKEFSVVLLERRPEGLRPTPAGLELARQGQTILSLIERVTRDMAGFASDAVRARDGQLTGSLDLGIVPSLTPIMLARLLRRITRAEPGLAVQVREGLNGEIVRQVREGALDLGVVWLPITESGLRTVALGASGLVAAVHRDHALADGPPVPLARLADEHWVAFPPGNPQRHWVGEGCRRAGFAPVVTTEVQTLAEAKAFVEAGVGVTLLPLASMRLEVASRRLGAVRLSPPPYQATIGYIAVERGDNPAAAAACRILDAEFQPQRLRDDGIAAPA